MLHVAEIEELLDQVLRGKREALQRIVREYSLPSRSDRAAQVYHLEDADDLAQEVFIAAYRSLHTFRRGDDFGAWLRRIARNKLYGHLRSEARREKTLARFRAEVARTMEADLERAASGDGPGTIEILLHGSTSRLALLIEAFEITSRAPRCPSQARLPRPLRTIIRNFFERPWHDPASSGQCLVVTNVIGAHIGATDVAGPGIGRADRSARGSHMWTGLSSSGLH